MIRLVPLFLFLLVEASKDTRSFHLAFGSCSRQNLPQPLWPLIQASHPDAFAWLGDIVYADRAVFAKIRIPGTLEEVRDAYLTQARTPGYVNLTQSIPVVGVWDDHDLGVNDGGADVPMDYRLASKQMLLDFLMEGNATDRRLRPDGVYTSYFLVPGSAAAGTPGRVHSADRPFPGAPFPTPPIPPHSPFAHLIMLDARFSRDNYPDNPWKEGSEGAEPQDTLGGSQWEWLEAQLQLGRAEGAAVPTFTILSSGYQMVPRGDAPVTEGWIRHPASLAKLLSLLALHAPYNGRYILLSGDVHFGELSALHSQPHLPLSPLFELTSSGMTHSWGGLLKGSLSWLLMDGQLRAKVGGTFPTTQGGGGGGEDTGLCYYSELNWGEVVMDFGVGEGEGASVATLRLRGSTGGTQIVARVQGGVGTGGRLSRGMEGVVKDGDARACATTPLVPPQGVTAACQRVLGVLAPGPDALHLRLVSILLHCAVLGFLGLVGVAVLALPPACYWTVSGRAGVWVSQRTGLGSLVSHAIVGAVFAVYASAISAVFWSVIEQLIV